MKLCEKNDLYVYQLLQAGAELESRDHIGWTALFHATYAGHQNVVKFLLENGANMEARSDMASGQRNARHIALPMGLSRQ